MNQNFSGSNRPRRPRGRKVITKSGRELKVNRSLGDRWSSMREAKAYRKVQRLHGLPKSRLKRLTWKLNPKRLAEYWFSRDGGIMALKVAGIAILAFFILTLGVFAYFRKDLPNIRDISGSNLGGSISYYDRTGQTLLFQDYNAVKRVPVQSKDISPFIKDATVAVEDKDFYKHRGFDLRGISRAAYNDVVKRGNKQGGSTITQQLVKLNQDWTEKRTFTRKLKELILAVELERTYTKNEILTGYLNAAPYGSVDYGVQAAASDYFHKSAKDLTLAESAFLAAIPKSPSIYSPYNKEFFDKEALISRQHYVLDTMVQTGKLKKSDADAAKQVDVLAEVQPQQTKYAGIKAPYFVLATKNELTRRFVPSNGNGSAKIGGWKVITTLDMNLQQQAEEQVQKGIAQVRRQGGDEAAFAAEEVKTGQMVALVGGVDFNDPDHGQINYAQTFIPPGSSFKPYDYTSLIENNNNVGAGSVLYDTQHPLPGYPCTNKTLPPPKGQGNCLEDYDFRYPGPLTVRYGLGGSRNVPAVKAILINGVNKTIKTAEAMGLRSGYKCFADEKLSKTTQCYGAAGIGDGAFLHLDEHVHGFATLSRLGQNVSQSYILQIQDASDKTIYKWKQEKPKQAVRTDSAYIVTDILQDPKASYFPAGRKPHRFNGWNFAMKTGTTNDAKDGWMMGYSTKYAAGVWVGYHNRQKAMSGTMENMTQPIWQGWMRSAHTNLPAENWKEPSSIQHQPGFVLRSHVGIGSVEPSPATEIYPSWYKPKAISSQTSTIDKVSNKLATNCTPAAAKQTVGGSSAPNQFSIDIFYPPGGGSASASASNTSASDDVHNCSDSPPTISLTVGDGSGNCNTSCTVTAFVSAGTHKFNDPGRSQFPGTVTFSVNGQVVKTQKVNDPQDNVSFSYNPTASGSATMTATVTDSVLYSGSDSKSVNLVSGGQTGPPIITAATATGTTTTISWIGGVGPYTVRNGFGVAVCIAPAGATSCSGSGAPKNSTVTLTDSNNSSSSRKVD